MDIKKFSVEHDYYCSGDNYYSKEAQSRWGTWVEFYEEFKDADIDLNLCFRWDIHKKDNGDGYSMEIFMIQQRKGIFHPHFIDSVYNHDLAAITEYLRKHWEKLQSIWKPISDS